MLLSFDTRERLERLSGGAAGGDRPARHSAHGGAVGGVAGAGAGGVAPGAAAGGGGGAGSGGGRCGRAAAGAVRSAAATGWMCARRRCCGLHGRTIAHSERWLLLLLLHHLVGRSHDAGGDAGGGAGASAGASRGSLPAPLPFRNYVAQARLGVSAAGARSVLPRRCWGMWRSRRRRLGCWMCRGTAAGSRRRSSALDAELARRLRAQARRLGVSAASAVSSGLGSGAGADQRAARMWCLARCCSGGCRAEQGRSGSGDVHQHAAGAAVDWRAGRAQERCGRRTQLLAELLRHEHASLALAQRCSGVPAPAPLFTALLNYRHSPLRTRGCGAAAGLARGSRCLAGEERTNYPLTLSVDDLGEGFALTAQVRSRGRAAADLRVSCTRRWSQLVEALEQAPQTPVLAAGCAACGGAASGAGASGTRRRRSIRRSRCIHELFEEQVAAYAGGGGGGV